jgi:mono/diheme cytochrome c family protein
MTVNLVGLPFGSPQTLERKISARIMILGAAALFGSLGLPLALKAQTDQLPAKSLTAPLSEAREQIRPLTEELPLPMGYTREQVVHGDRVFHGEAAGGQCYVCHGQDARGTPNGNDLTTGMFLWGDGSVASIKRTITHNMSIVPGMDGDLRPEDTDAVAAYVWAID